MHDAVISFSTFLAKIVSTHGSHVWPAFVHARFGRLHWSTRHRHRIFTAVLCLSDSRATGNHRLSRDIDRGHAIRVWRFLAACRPASLSGTAAPSRLCIALHGGGRVTIEGDAPGYGCGCGVGRRETRGRRNA